MGAGGFCNLKSIHRETNTRDHFQASGCPWGCFRVSMKGEHVPDLRASGSIYPPHLQGKSMHPQAHITTCPGLRVPPCLVVKVARKRAPAIRDTLAPLGIDVYPFGNKPGNSKKSKAWFAGWIFREQVRKILEAKAEYEKREGVRVFLVVVWDKCSVHECVAKAPGIVQMLRRANTWAVTFPKKVGPFVQLPDVRGWGFWWGCLELCGSCYLQASPLHQRKHTDTQPPQVYLFRSLKHHARRAQYESCWESLGLFQFLAGAVARFSEPHYWKQCGFLLGPDPLDAVGAARVDLWGLTSPLYRLFQDEPEAERAASRNAAQAAARAQATARAVAMAAPVDPSPSPDSDDGEHPDSESDSDDGESAACVDSGRDSDGGASFRRDRAARAANRRELAGREHVPATWENFHFPQNKKPRDS